MGVLERGFSRAPAAVGAGVCIKVGRSRRSSPCDFCDIFRQHHSRRIRLHNNSNRERERRRRESACAPPSCVSLHVLGSICLAGCACASTHVVQLVFLERYSRFAVIYGPFYDDGRAPPDTNGSPAPPFPLENESQSIGAYVCVIAFRIDTTLETRSIFRTFHFI